MRSQPNLGFILLLSLNMLASTVQASYGHGGHYKGKKTSTVGYGTVFRFTHLDLFLDLPILVEINLQNGSSPSGSHGFSGHAGLGHHGGYGGYGGSHYSGEHGFSGHAGLGHHGGYGGGHHHGGGHHGGYGHGGTSGAYDDH